MGRLHSTLNRAVKEAWERLRRGNRPDFGRVQALERNRQKTCDRLLRATERFVDGEIDRQAYDLLRDKVQQELAMIDAELTRLRRALLTASLG